MQDNMDKTDPTEEERVLLMIEISISMFLIF